MTKYFKWEATVPEDKLLKLYWENSRGGDNLYSIYWLYNITGDKWLLDLADKIHRNTANWSQKNNLPKDKPLTQLRPNLKKREETFFSFSMNNENNNIEFANDNGVNQDKDLIPPKDVKSFPASPNGGNSFYAPKFDLSDLKFLESFPDNIEELKSDIEKSKQSLTELTWNTLKHEIKENLDKIKMPRIGIRLDKSQFPSEFEELTKLKVNTQQEFKKFFDIDMLLKDSLSKKNMHFFNNNVISNCYNENSDYTYYISPGKPEKVKKPINITSPQIANKKNSTPYPEVCLSSKSLGKHTIYIVYKDGKVIIDGNPINSTDLKKLGIKINKNFTWRYNNNLENLPEN